MPFIHELLKNIVPTYAKDKWAGRDVAQVNSIPDELRTIIIHGEDRDATAALGSLSGQGIILSEAALELLYDMRVTAQHFTLKE